MISEVLSQQNKFLERGGILLKLVKNITTHSNSTIYEHKHIEQCYLFLLFNSGDMAYRQVAQRERLDLLHRLQLAPQSKTPDTVLEWTRLDINSVGIDNLPVSIDRCTNVQQISAAFNRLSSLPQSISNLPYLTVLNLSRNAFTTFPIALCGLNNLKELNLSYNQLSDIPVDISRLKVLRMFRLKRNAFTTFPIALCGLTNLEVLNLSHNQISDIPVDISRLTKLETLHLFCNNITHLSHQMKNMGSLRRLYVDGNPLVQPPKDTANRGLGAIKRYFEALTDTKAIQSSRIQVNFLGETEAGKTSISRTLQLGRPFLTEAAHSTRVVEQGTWDPDQDVGFNINDFGGHDIYKIGHPIFISKYGLVFITFNLSKYDPDDTAHYQLYIGHWIDKVQTQMPGIQIALIGTHLDEVEIQLVENKCFAINKQHEDHIYKKKQWYQVQKEYIEKRMREIPKTQASLRQAYLSKAVKLQTLYGQMKPIYQHIFRVSSKTYKGVQRLRTYLVSFARKNAEVMPGLWVEVAKNICTKKIEGSENTLGWKMIEDLILQNAPTPWKEKNSKEETERMICDILSFLAHRGDIIWFDRCPSLMKVVFHKQEVLANVLKAVFSHDQEAVSQKFHKSMTITGTKARTIHEDIFSRGIISKEAMSCLCQPFKFSSNEVDVMVELMQKLEVCYHVQEDEPLPSSTSFHFPWLLTEERQPEVDNKWPSKVPPDTTQLTLEVLFPYKSCPDGLYEKFCVSQHKHLGLMKTIRMDWKDRVYAEFEGCKIQLTRGPHLSNPDAVSQDPDWVISIAVRGSQLSDMWGVFMQGNSDLMNIIEEDWPGLSYDKYLVCPHCVSKDSEHPTLFPGEILDLTLGTTSKPRQVPCVNTGVSISADLVYPPHLTMSWQEVVNKNNATLKQYITKSWLFDMIDVFIQEGILSDHEYEEIIESPEKTVVFLDILTKKPDRAHEILCQWLEEQGQTHILELIQPTGPSMLHVHVPVANATSTKFQTEEELLMPKVPDFIDKEVLKKMIRDLVPHDERKKMGAVIQRNCFDLQKKHPNISRICISRQEADEDGEKKPCIAIYCSDLTNVSEFPKKLEEYPVEVREGTFLLNADNEGNRDNDHSQLHIGCSVGLPSSQGSLGLFVNHQRSDPALTKPQAFLTSSHVVCPYGSSFETASNKPVYVENNQTLKKCGFVRKCYAGNVELDNGSGSKSPYGVDIALVELCKHAEANLFAIHHHNTSSFNNVEIADVRCFSKPVLVYKFGKTTGLTYGLFSSEYDYCCDTPLIDGTSGVSIPFSNMITVLSIPTLDKPTFSEEGDSGSAVFVERNNDKRVIIGTVVGSSLDPAGKVQCSIVSQINPSLHTMKACIYKPPQMAEAMQIEEAQERKEQEMETE